MQVINTSLSIFASGKAWFNSIFITDSSLISVNLPSLKFTKISTFLKKTNFWTCGKDEWEEKHNKTPMKSCHLFSHFHVNIIFSTSNNYITLINITRNSYSLKYINTSIWNIVIYHTVQHKIDKLFI